MICDRFLIGFLLLENIRYGERSKYMLDGRGEEEEEKTNTKHAQTVRRLVLFVDDGAVGVVCRQHASSCKRSVNDHIERQVTSENLANARI